MSVKVSSKSQNVTSNTTLMPEGFGGWYCKNVGNTDVVVDGFLLGAGESLDFHDLAPNVIWNTPITIVFDGGSGSLRITRLQYA